MSAKKSFRNITVNGHKFYFRRAGCLTGEIADNGFSIRYSPLEFKQNYLSVEFPLSVIEVPPSEYSGVDKDYPYPGLLTPYFYDVKAVKHGEQVMIEFGKTRIIAEILAYVLEHELWDVGKRVENQVIDGWEILKALGYREFLPHLTWSW